MTNRLKSCWAGLFLLASGWQFLLPVFTPPHFWFGILLVVAGAFVNGLAVLDAAETQSGAALPLTTPAATPVEGQPPSPPLEAQRYPQFFHSNNALVLVLQLVVYFIDGCTISMHPRFVPTMTPTGPHKSSPGRSCLTKDSTNACV